MRNDQLTACRIALVAAREMIARGDYAGAIANLKDAIRWANRAKAMRVSGQACVAIRQCYRAVGVL